MLSLKHLCRIGTTDTEKVSISTGVFAKIGSHIIDNAMYDSPTVRFCSMSKDVSSCESLR
jgi:hypothetical protein